MKHSPFKQRHAGLCLVMRFDEEVVLECGDQKIIAMLMSVGSNQAQVKFSADKSVRIYREKIGVSRDRLAELMRLANEG